MEAIYTPQTTSFQQVLLALAKNRRYTTIATPKPLAIVAAKHERHVQATVICAKQHGLEIRIRSDGHDYEGLSYVSDVPFVILDMLNLRSIDVNVTEGRVWVQSGATVGELYYEVGKKSRVHGVAAGSFRVLVLVVTWGGCGNGPLLRKYGLTGDNVEDGRLVNNVNGEILDCNSVGEDLFWAIRLSPTEGGPAL
ncbi:tetrahydroberberine oxidase-like [Pyrus communis]|uniref:tetrahydroberberine oxidase-like n=1 Tax=Pyrus communis TaxID=23211 RepID=UPI0035BF4C13